MPSPFPGMDPYLEHPALWPGVHQGLITYARSALNAVLPPQYIADMGERLYTEMREVFIEILSVADESRVITVIEVLSPGNKTLGSEGRQLYLTMQLELLRSPTHLIEIDLLRQGEHTVAPPRESLLEKGRWDYLVSLHRGGERGRYEIGRSR